MFNSIKLPYDRAIPLLHLLKRVRNIHSHKNLPKNFIALFIIAKTWKQPKCPLADQWINKMRYIHTTEYYLAMKRNEILIHDTTWMSLKNMLNKRKQERSHITLFHLSGMSRIGKSVQIERLVVARGKGLWSWRRERYGEWLLMDMGFLLWGGKNVLKLVVMVIQTTHEFLWYMNYISVKLFFLKGCFIHCELRLFY